VQADWWIFIFSSANEVGNVIVINTVCLSVSAGLLKAWSGDSLKLSRKFQRNRPITFAVGSCLFTIRDARQITLWLGGHPDILFYLLIADVNNWWRHLPSAWYARVRWLDLHNHSIKVARWQHHVMGCEGGFLCLLCRTTQPEFWVTIRYDTIRYDKPSFDVCSKTWRVASLVYCMQSKRKQET